MNKYIISVLLFLVFSIQSFAEDLNLITKSTVKTTHSVSQKYIHPTIPNAYQIITTTQSGSGTIIKKTDDCFYILSCCHTVEHQGIIGVGELKVHTWDGKILPAKLISYDKKSDLSLIKVDAKVDVLSVKVANKEDYNKTVIVKSGHPLGGKISVLKGVCIGESFHSDDPETRSVIGSPESIKGDSGGGLFRDSDSQLVGVVWGCANKNLHATKIRNIWIFLGKTKY